MPFCSGPGPSDRICTHRQELHNRHEYASPLKKMLICGRCCWSPARSRSV